MSLLPRFGNHAREVELERRVNALQGALAQCKGVARRRGQEPRHGRRRNDLGAARAGAKARTRLAAATVASPAVMAGLDPAIHPLRKKLLRSDGPPEIGFTRFRAFTCASRINPTCVVKPAGDVPGCRSRSREGPEIKSGAAGRI